MTPAIKRLVDLANAYHTACQAMTELWAAVLKAPANSDERSAAIVAYNKGSNRVMTAKSALLADIRDGESEIGIEPADPVATRA